MMTYSLFFDEWRDGRDYVICLTSGSTGAPKQIKLPKELMRDSALRTIEYFNLNSRSHLHSCISPDFIGGKMMAVRSEILGSGFSYETPSNTPLISYDGPDIDLLAVVPSQMVYILDNLSSLPKVKNYLIGGSPIPDSIRMKIVGQGLNAFESYGMTETASHIALRKVSDPSLPFRPLPGIEVSLDGNHRLMIHNKMFGENNFLLTNDIAEIDDDGQFFIIGRYDNVIISGGKKIHPEVLESTLESVLGIPVLFYAEKDEKWGEKLILCINKSPEELSDERLKGICRLNLPDYCVPKKIIRKEIPVTANGKKRRKP